MTIGRAPFDATATMVPVPATVLAKVIRPITGADPAIAQVPQGHFLLVDVRTVPGTPDHGQS